MSMLSKPAVLATATTIRTRWRSIVARDKGADKTSSYSAKDARAYCWPLRSLIASLSLLLALALYNASHADAQQSPTQAPITIAIFSDRQLSADQWTAIASDVETERVLSIPALAHSPLQVLRGNEIIPGIVVDRSISVYLHGNCELAPRAAFAGRQATTGALGWTISRHGQLESFAHVDCDRINQLLAPRIAGMHRDERDRLMALAITHVILHEWNHIATQSAHHAAHGLTKSTFSAQDLMFPSTQPAAPFRHGQ